MIACSGVGVRAAGKDLLQNVAVTAPAGSVTALIGPNGSGKTTLLRALLGLVPCRGTVQLAGHDVARLSAPERARLAAYVPQQSQLDAAFTVQEVVALGGFARGGVDIAGVARALEQCGVLELAHRSFHTLSGGERARALLARALVSQAPVLLADEPGAHLDLRHRLELGRLLRGLAAAGRTVLLVQHELERLSEQVDRVILLDRGRVLAQGPTDQVLASPELQLAYRVRLVPRGGWGVEPLS